MSKAWKSSDRKGWRRIRERILARDGYCCQACGESEGSLHIDHIVPKRLGGSDLEENLQVLCKNCNLRKGGSFFEHPLTPPTLPVSFTPKNDSIRHYQDESD